MPVPVVATVFLRFSRGRPVPLAWPTCVQLSLVRGSRRANAHGRQRGGDRHRCLRSRVLRGTEMADVDSGRLLGLVRDDVKAGPSATIAAPGLLELGYRFTGGSCQNPDGRSSAQTKGSFRAHGRDGCGYDSSRSRADGRRGSTREEPAGCAAHVFWCHPSWSPARSPPRARCLRPR